MVHTTRRRRRPRMPHTTRRVRRRPESQIAADKGAMGKAPDVDFFARLPVGSDVVKSADSSVSLI